MNTVLKRGLSALALAVVLATPAYAQVATQASVTSMCAISANACVAAQNAYVTAMRQQGLSAAQIGAAMGAVVAALVNSGIPAATIAAAAGNSVQYASSPAQASAFNQIAQVASTGGTIEPAVVQAAASSSPN